MQSSKLLVKKTKTKFNPNRDQERDNGKPKFIYDEDEIDLRSIKSSHDVLLKEENYDA